MFSLSHCVSVSVTAAAAAKANQWKIVNIYKHSTPSVTTVNWPRPELSMHCFNGFVNYEFFARNDELIRRMAFGCRVCRAHVVLVFAKFRMRIEPFRS